MKLLVEQTQNLVNVFLLPLIKRSSKDFSDKFINSYLDIETYHIVVEVTEVEDKFKEFPNYDYSVKQREDKHFLFYELPEAFYKDIRMFIDGRYSEFSTLAKNYIRQYSKLPRRIIQNGEEEKSVWLHVIDKTEKLRRGLEDQLGVTIPKETELASKPNTNNFFHNQ